MISPLKDKDDKDLVIGWGATCGHHQTVMRPDQTCKKTFRLVGLSSEDCKRLAKTWCIEGLKVAKDDSCGKDVHLSMDRSTFQLLTDSQLDDGLRRATKLYQSR